ENVYSGGDIAFHNHPVLGRPIRVEHWEVAKGHGRGIAASVVGGDAPYTKLPYFWSDQYDVSLEYRGNAAGDDTAAWRGDRRGLLILADQVAGDESECSHECRVFRLVADLAVLRLPADQRAAGLGQPEKVAPDLVPGRTAAFLFDRVDRRLLGFVDSLQTVQPPVAVPALRSAFHAGRGKHADVVDQARQRALVLGESIAFGVDTHGD